MYELLRTSRAQPTFGATFSTPARPSIRRRWPLSLCVAYAMLSSRRTTWPPSLMRRRPINLWRTRSSASRTPPASYTWQGDSIGARGGVKISSSVKLISYGGY